MPTDKNARILYVQKLLLEQTDIEHFLTVQQIIVSSIIKCTEFRQIKYTEIRHKVYRFPPVSVLKPLNLI